MKGKAAMVEYVGFGVSKEETAFGVMDKDGRVLARGKTDSNDTKLLAEITRTGFYLGCGEKQRRERGSYTPEGGLPLACISQTMGCIGAENLG